MKILKSSQVLCSLHVSKNCLGIEQGADLGGCTLGVRRFYRQKFWKNRSAKAMSKMLAK